MAIAVCERSVCVSGRKVKPKSKGMSVNPHSPERIGEKVHSECVPRQQLPFPNSSTSDVNDKLQSFQRHLRAENTKWYSILPR